MRLFDRTPEELYRKHDASNSSTFLSYLPNQSIIMPLTLDLIEGDFTIAKLPPDAQVPAWALKSRVFSTITRNTDELSILCPTLDVLETPELTADTGWKLLKLRGPFAFDLKGILLSVLAPLAAAEVSILAISTFDTDYVWVKSEKLEDAIDALVLAGHIVEG